MHFAFFIASLFAVTITPEKKYTLKMNLATRLDDPQELVTVVRYTHVVMFVAQFLEHHLGQMGFEILVQFFAAL